MKSATSTTTNAGALSSNSFFLEQQDLYYLSANKKTRKICFLQQKAHCLNKMHETETQSSSFLYLFKENLGPEKTTSTQE